MILLMWTLPVPRNTMDVNIWLSTFYFSSLLMCVYMDPRVHLTVPVSPVKENGMLSIKCQAYETDDSNQIGISRNLDGKLEILSMGEHINPGVDDRFFLAVRRLEEGSVVYFLSVINVEKQDKGEYFCTVFRLLQDGGMETVSRAAASIDVSFFPGDIYPMCSVSPGPLLQGNTIALNCSSEDSNESVDIKWKRSNRADEVLDTNQVRQNGLTHSVHQLRLKLSDNQVMFLCEITHPQFPDKVQTCHVGPLKVIRNPLPDPDIDQPSPTRTVDTSQDNGVTWDKPFVADKTANCKDICDSISSGISYWVIATVAACTLAIFFLIIGIVLAVKLHKRLNHNMLPPSTYHEDIYSEIHSRMDSNRVYMTLAKIDNPVNQGTQPNWKLEGNYTGTPIAIKP